MGDLVIIRIVHDVPAAIFGVEADGAFDRPDLDAVMLDFDGMNRTRIYKKLLVCYADKARPSVPSLADKYANRIAMKDIWVAALVGSEIWHEPFRLFCDAVGAQYRIFARGQRDAAVSWLLEQAE